MHKTSAIMAGIALMGSVYAAPGAIAQDSAPPSGPQATATDNAVSSPATRPSASKDERAIKAEMKKFGVSTADQNRLISMVKSGKKPMAFDPLAEATSVEDRLVDGEPFAVSRYADGSFKATSLLPEAMDAQSDIVTTMGSITECNYSSGSGWAVYTNCKVRNVWSGFVTVEFRATFQHVQNIGGKIISINSATQNCGLVSCSRPDAWIGKADSGYSGTAVARAQTTVNAAWGSWEAWLELKVNRTTHWTANS